MSDDVPTCFLCNRKPHELDEYLDAIYGTDASAEEYVRREEGTYNRRSGLFCCTACYVAIGCPTGRNRWTAPDVDIAVQCSLCRRVTFSQYVEFVSNGYSVEARPMNGGRCTTCGVLERDATGAWVRHVPPKHTSEDEGMVGR